MQPGIQPKGEIGSLGATMLASSEFLELIIFHQVNFFVYFVQEMGI